MKAPFQPSRWWAIGTTIVCIAVVPTLNVTTPGLWISRAAQLNGADDYRTALMFANDTGWLLVGLLACWLPVHRLGRAMAAACALLMLLAMATGDFVPAIFLPLAVVGGGLHVCVWSLLLQHVLGLERHLRSAAVMLDEIVSGASYLVALGAVAPLLFAMNQRVSFALAAVAALLVGVASTWLGVAPAGSVSRAPARVGFVSRLAFLLLVGVPAQIAASAIIRRLIDPRDLLAFRPWLQPASALVAAAGLLAFLFGLSVKDRQPTMRVVAVGLFCGAALSFLFLSSVPVLRAGWGVGPAFLVALGTAVVWLSTTLLLVLASVVTPARLVPLVIAVWFVKDAVLSRWLAPLAADARDDVGTIVVAMAAAAVLAAAGLTAWSLAKREWLRIN